MTPEDGLWYYRVTSETEAGNESPLSEQASAESDSVMPCAVSISYAPSGPCEPETGRTGIGRVELVLAASEPLAAIPFLSVTPENGLPILVDLKKESETLYSGAFDIEETTKSGTAWAVFSGRDPAGNRGSRIDSGETLLIDTEGPDVRRIEISPASPVQNDEQSPTAVVATIGLNEKTKSGSAPELSFTLSGLGASFPADAVVEIPAAAGDVQTFRAEFVLPPEAGLASPETLSFVYAGTDDLENRSETIACANAFQIYQGDLPPLDPPAGLSAESMPGGVVELSWNEVENAADYQLYRQDPGQGGLEPLVRSAGATRYEDGPSQDGDYMYAVASVRFENGEESVGAPCDPVSAASDSVPPQAPFGLVLELVPRGILATWEQYEDPEEEGATFNLYRSGQTEIVDIDGLVPVSTKISGTEAVDSQPSPTEHCYAATALDAAGNESAPCLSEYLNFDLLPAADLSVELADGQPPLISWSHPSEDIEGFHIHLETESGRARLNETLLTEPSFVDAGFSGDSRRYAVSAVDENGTESLESEIFLPMLEFDPAEGAGLKRSIVNRLEFEVENLSGEAVENIALRVTVAGREHVSETFDLAADAVEIVPVAVGGYADLEDVEQIVVAAEIAPDDGGFARISRTLEIDVGDGALVLEAFSEELTRGGTGNVWFSLENTGSEQIEIVTAKDSGGSASEEILFELLDSDGNALSAAEFRQAFGESVLSVSGGYCVARIEPGERFVSNPVPIPIPSGAPDTATLSVSISTIFHRLGEEDEISMEGVAARRQVSLKETSYYGELTGIDPETSRGDGVIEIGGKALARTTGAPVGRAPLNVVVSSNGFEREFEVFADDAGEFVFAYEPSSGDAGIYAVSVLHPDATERTLHGTFEIERVKLSPRIVKMDIPVNHEQRVSISASVSEGLAIENLRLACEAADQPGGSVPEGVHVACEPAVGHAEGEDAALFFTVMADDSAPESAEIVLRLVGDRPSDEPWAYVTVNAKFSDASPRLEVSPDQMDTGVVRGESVSETLALKNTGYEKMENVRIRLTDAGGEPAPDWIMPSGEKSLGDIGIGETKQAGLVFSPTESTSEGLRDLTLRIASDNHPEALIGVRVAVVQSGIGSALVKVSDIYTGTVDPDTSRTIEGLSGASVVLQNEAVATEIHTARTDAAGEALFSDIPAGLYACRVSADGHNPHSGTVKIKPGVAASESVFLMNRLVNVEWSVTETTIEDVYEIEAVATFETDVPAPVVVFEPAGIVLPSGMKAGDVHRGEFKMTNQGLVRAESIRFELPENDPYFQFELADALPDTLEAKQSAVVAYRVVCLKSLGDDGSDGSGGETECAQYTYEADIRVVAEATCADGVPRDFYWNQKIKVPFDFCYEVDEDGNIASEIDIGSEGASIDTSSYGIVNEPECTGGSEDCILCSAKRPEFEIEIDRCALMDALVFGSDPLDAVTLKVSSPHKELQIFKETMVPMEDTGSSVDPLKGEYIRSKTDLAVKVPGGKIKVRRTYVGNRWRLEPSRTNMLDPGAPQLEFETSGGEIERIVRNRAVYEKKADGLWIHRDVYSIAETPDGYRWEDKVGRYEDYDESGRFAASGDRDGATAMSIYEPGGGGRLSGYADRNGVQILWFSYNADGLISAVYDSENRRVEYEYENGLPVRVVDVLGNATTYDYDDRCRLVRATDPSGNTIEISYDRAGRVASVLDSEGNGKSFEYGYESLRKEFRTKVKTTGGLVKELWFDKDGETRRIDINGETVKKIEKQGRNLLITDSSGLTVTKEYDERDNLTKIVYPDGTSVEYEYDLRFNKPTRIADERGVEYAFEYDDSGNLAQKTYAAGSAVEQTTEYEYDEAGNLVAIRRLKGGTGPHETDAEILRTYDDCGNMTSETDPEGNITRFTYDCAGNLASRQDPNGNVWNFTYDDAGNLRSAADPLGNRTVYEYDDAGKLVRTEDPRGNETSYSYDERGRTVGVTDANGNTASTEYDADGNIVSRTDREGKKTLFEYDPEGRLAKTIDGNGNEIEHVYADYSASSCSSCSSAPSDRPVKTIYPTFAREYAYDERGRKILETDVFAIDGIEQSLETGFAYDPSGNLASQTDRESNATRYEYDDLNRLTKVADAMGGETKYAYDIRNNLVSVTDANGNTTRFGYDRNNRLVKETRPMGQETTYEYDPAGNLIGKIDAKNQKTEYDYDAANRLTQIRYYEFGDWQSPVKTVEFHYDPSGNLAGYSDGVTSADYSYDDLNRKTHETVDYGPFSLSYGYTYYNNGLKRSFTGPDGIEYAYTYDDNNQLASVSIPEVGSIAVNETEWNRPTRITLPGGTTKAYAYDPLMRVETIASCGPAGNTLMRHDYEYDNVGNITAKDTEHGKYVYDYDDLYRLTMADNPTLPDEFYTYDPVGNRLTSADDADWSYNANNELQGYDGLSFEYDENGNTVRKTAGSEIVRYIYNVEDRLKRIEDVAANVIATYYYDPFGRRLWKEVSGEKTHFLYADEGMIGEYDADGSEIKIYGWKPDSIWGTDPVIIKEGRRYFFFQTDHIATSKKISDPSGEAVWSAVYDSFGKICVKNEDLKQPFRFAGQNEDLETGLHYNFKRYYDPRIGRYISPDPLGLRGGDQLFSFYGRKSDKQNRSFRSNQLAWNFNRGNCFHRRYVLFQSGKRLCKW